MPQIARKDINALFIGKLKKKKQVDFEKCPPKKNKKDLKVGLEK